MAERSGRGPLRANGTDPVEAVARDEADLRSRAREALGVAGRAEWVPWADALKTCGTGWYPLLASCFFAGAIAAVVAVPSLLLGAARDSLGPGAMALVEPLGPVFFALGALGALEAQRHLDRLVVLRCAGALAALATFTVALASSSFVATLGAFVVTAAAGASSVVVVPFLVDLHRPEVRFRTVAAYGAATASGVGVAALVVAVEGGVDLTWRMHLLTLAVVMVIAVAATGRLVEPAPGVHDAERLGTLVEERLGASNGQHASADPRLSISEEFRRVFAIHSAPTMLLMASAYGLFAGALPRYLDIFFRDRWTIVAPGRTLTLGVLCLGTVPVVAWYGHRGEIAARRSLAHVLDLTGTVAAGAAAALALAVVAPVFAVSALLLAGGLAGFVVLLVGGSFGLLVLCEPARRGHAAAALGVATAVGVVGGRVSLSTIGDRFGLGWGLLDAALGLLIAGRMARAIHTVDRDLDAFVDRQVERADLAIRVAHGQHVPLLSCRDLDFAYGQVQVLFDVSFTVDEGEMVALLGTNGAGKSTLLRLVSGLEHPTSGTIRFRGADVTYVDTDRRVELGLCHVLGGRGVFGGLTVADNLRAYAFTQGRDSRKIEQGIDDAFAAFPRLAERRSQLAQTLSGGEQQMLALAVAFVRRPQLLLIDELSLGLAPKVVGELLDMVREVNARGTAVVLVEQSVNIALSVVERAYFMEKGEMRFEGEASELLARPDLVRSVFLEGATAGIASGISS